MTYTEARYVTGYCPVQNKEYEITVNITGINVLGARSMQYKKTLKICDYNTEHGCDYANNYKCPIVSLA